MNNVKLCGITGGIGSGKSTVAELFDFIYDIKTYNCDKTVKEKIVYTHDVMREITKIFGEDSYTKDSGKYNIEKFKKLLFIDKNAISKMDDIILPALMKDIEEWSLKFINEKYVLIECATAFESDIYKNFDKNILVTSSLNLRIERLLKKGLTFEDIQNRIRNQYGDYFKTLLCDYEIVNNDNEDNLITQIDYVHRELYCDFYLK